MNTYAIAYLLTTLSVLLGVTQAQSTLSQVRQAGVLRCGVAAASVPFSFEQDGRTLGFDADFCRAIASAVLGDAEAVEFVVTTPQERFSRLAAGDYEVLIRTTTWTFSRDANRHNLDFAPTTFYDGQGLLAQSSQKRGVRDYQDPIVCVVDGTTSQRNLADFFAARDLPYSLMIFRDDGQAIQAFEAGLCTLYTSDRSVLAGQRSRLANPESYMILDDSLSKEPLGPAVREGDDQWYDIVSWVVFALIQAEEWGLTQANVRENAERTPFASLQYLLNGKEGSMRAFGLDDDAMTRAIAAVGNYGEIYERYFGANSLTPIPRGLNNLWTRGGILYSPPFSPAQ